LHVLTLPAQLKIDDIGDLDIDYPKEALVVLYVVSACLASNHLPHAHLLLEFALVEYLNRDDR